VSSNDGIRFLFPSNFGKILARRTKYNPVLIGQAGVGNTAIAKGLAQRIVSGQVPESMKNKRVLSLDVAALISSTNKIKTLSSKIVEGRSWIKLCCFNF
jgi:stage III sporulation protein SpoIIIAA